MTPPSEGARSIDIQLHRLIAASSGAQLGNGQYDDAVFNAFKAVEDRVKRLSGKSEIGKRLMTYVFNENAPSLDITSPNADNDQKADEREGYKFLFMGATLGLRNPRGHGGHLDTGNLEASEMVALASLLMRALDRAEEELASRPPEPDDSGEWDAEDGSTDEQPGALDLIAAAENVLPGVASNLDEMTECLTQLGSITADYTPKINAAAQSQTMAARLVVIQELAGELSAPAGRFRQLAAEYAGQMAEANGGIDALTHLNPYADMSVDDQAKFLFLAEAVKGLRDASVEGVGAASNFSRTFSDVAKLSKALRKPSADIRDGVRQMESVQHYLNDWVDGFKESGVWDSPARD